MANVSVERSAITKAIAICQQAIQELQSTSSSLQRKYQAAGTSWKDSKYTQLGSIVNTCNTSLKNPIEGLKDCIKKLEALEKAVSDYEDINF